VNNFPSNWKTPSCLVKKFSSNLYFYLNFFKPSGQIRTPFFEKVQGYHSNIAQSVKIKPAFMMLEQKTLTSPVKRNGPERLSGWADDPPKHTQLEFV